MNNVRSRSLAGAAPLPRRWLDNIAPGVRPLFGALFIAWSWISTIIIIGWLLEPVLHQRALLILIPDRFVIGLVVAALVTIATQPARHGPNSMSALRRGLSTTRTSAPARSRADSIQAPMAAATIRPRPRR